MQYREFLEAKMCMARKSGFSVEPDQIHSMRSRGWQVDAIDEEVPLGFCEMCDRPIFEDDDYQTDEEGVCWHTKCPTDF